MFQHHCGNTVAIVLSVSMAMLPHAAAQEMPKAFDISAGPAESTITEFARQAGINILASEEFLVGVTTRAVQGRYLVAEALQIMLSDTGLTSRVNTSGAVFIMRAAPGHRADLLLDANRDPTMTEHSTPMQRTATCCAVSAALMLMGSPLAAQAQTTAAPAPAPATPETARAPGKAAAKPGADEITTVLVVGARASQQSAIARKKNADTAQDSIIAEDVGAFPDRNVADAISRIAGVAVNRGDYGEGVTVSIRGNGPELTRVELDGQGVQAAGGTDMLGGITAGQDGAAGRGVEMRQLSSDLIKSVDVIKGSTADMTEGSLGGAVKIQTRTGLDFKKDYFSMRLAASRQSINKKISPDMNVVWSKKFLDNRLGVLVNVSKTRSSNESHSITAGGSNNVAGPQRLIDFDNSPEKTFSFQPQTVKDDQASRTPLRVSNLAAGGTFNFATPEELVTRSAAAKTKADCYAAFPLLTPQQQATFSGGSNRTNAINQRQLELTTCLGQWNDWTPNLLRNFVNRAEDRRWSGDLRLDFKVNRNLTVYIKHNASKGTVDAFAHSAGMGNVSVNPGTVTVGSYTGPATLDTAGLQPDGAAAKRVAAPGSGYFTYPGLTYFNGAPRSGIVSNIDPASVKVDANHHVTSLDIIDAGFGIESTYLKMQTKSAYTQAGGTYRNGGFRADLLLGNARSEFFRHERRAGYSSVSGRANIKVLPNGLWAHTFPGDNQIDTSDPAKYLRLMPSPAVAAVTSPTQFVQATPAYTPSQLPLITSNFNLPFQNPRINESHEKTVKLDMSWSTSERIPFVYQIKSGFNLRDSGYDHWGLGGATLREPVGTFGTAGYQPGIYMPTNNLRTVYQVCQDTPGSLAPGGRPCNYGYTPNYDPRFARHGVIRISPQQFGEIFRQALSVPPHAQFYGSDPERPAGLIEGWKTIDIDKLYSLLGVPNYNLDCIKSCTASDGKVYDQTKSSISEKVTSGYLMANFEVDRFPFTERALPFGLVFDGNFGYRMVTTEVNGKGLLTFVSHRTTDSYDPLDRNNPAGFTTSTYRKETLITARNTDYLPSLNLNTWLVPDKLVLRYNQAKTVARPSAGRLLPSGTCTYDQRFEGELDNDGTERDQVCSGTMGNPALRPLTNRNKNLSLEWYINKDMMLSGSVFKQKGIIGAPTLREVVQGARLFEGSPVIDEQTGRPLSEFEFNYGRWINQLPNERRGFEVSGKTAFTFLPWHLRYTGLDANYTRNKSALTGTVVRDLLTGTVMPVAGEPRHSWNASLWYDDGALSARVALQVVAEVFSCISGCNTTAVNNYPTNGLTTVRGPTYNPAPPVFRRGTRYLDAKIGYKFKNGIELFAEGRNLGKIHTGSTSGAFSTFEDGTTNVYTDAFHGSKLMVGVNFKLM